MNLFDYLIKLEETDRDFMFGRTGTSLFIAYNGYNHMNLSNIIKEIKSKYKLKYDFSEGRGMQKFNNICGKTFCYFKDVYND